MRNGTNHLITIRKLQREDKTPIHQILEETGVFTREEIKVAMELIDIALEDPHQKDYEILTGVNENSEVVGYVCVGPTPLTEGTFDLYWIAVKPDHTNRGVGKKLLQHAEELVRSNGGRLLLAETSSQPKYDKTRSFYARNNFLEIACVANYYKVGDDLIICGKYVSQSEGT